MKHGEIRKSGPQRRDRGHRAVSPGLCHREARQSRIDSACATTRDLRFPVVPRSRASPRALGAAARVFKNEKRGTVFGVAGDGGQRVAGFHYRDPRPAKGSFEGIGIDHARHASFGSCAIPSMAPRQPARCGNSNIRGTAERSVGSSEISI